MYGSKYWLTKKDNEIMMEVVVITILRCTFCWMLMDNNLNVNIRKLLGVTQISKKVKEGQLCWYGYVLRRISSLTVRIVKSVMIDGKSRRGHP